MELLLDSPSDQTILSALRTGEQRRAAELLVQHYSQTVYSAVRCAAEPLQAEDWTYGAFARAFNALRGYRGEGSPGRWLLETACHLLLEALPPATGDVVSTPPDSAVVPSPEEVRRALPAMPARERAVLALGHRFIGEQQLGDAVGELPAAEARLRLLLADDGGQAPGRAATLELYRELNWRMPEALRRRLEVLCAAL